ncbi:MAG: leucine--tRNA ligase, partial [Prevotella sp.]|nr:leucine--tRNA ligase [Prevotella sp.]
LRVSAYAQRLLDGLETIDWTDSLKETQRNWIGRSEGAEVEFKVADSDLHFTIFTTRADTMFGVTFMVLAPESELVEQLTTPEQKKEVDDYIAYVKKRTERERQMDHKVTGVFSGSYAINPFTDEKIPIWIAEYVLAGYGTGAIMAVPAHDSRDYAFAKHFNLPIIPLIEGADVSEESYDAKEGIVCNSESKKFSLNGLTVKEAIAATKKFVSENHLGRVKVNYRLRDAIFSRQRYWGEPFPVYYKDGMPYMIPEECLPLQLPEVDQYKPTEDGQPPLGHAKKWAWDTKSCSVVDIANIDHKTVFPLELFTMPGFAGSSAYYLRYMDPHNEQALVSKDADEYWQNVDLYVGGTEHATGHLIYSRFWNKFLFDLGVSCKEEPFQKLVNQGMIQGRSNFVYRVNSKEELEKYFSGRTAEHLTNGAPVFVSVGLKEQFSDITPIHVDVNIVANDILDIETFRAWRPDYEQAAFILEDGSVLTNTQHPTSNTQYKCGWAIEKMSKSMFNVVNPDMIVEKYGADTLRLYEMFLGPVEQSKPWDTNGIDGCHRFLKKFWNLFDGVSAEHLTATAEELKALHKLIKKVSQDIPAFSYNTSISAFMICVNELSQLKCKNPEILKQLVILIAPFAPHIAEELWERLGQQGSVCDAQ